MPHLQTRQVKLWRTPQLYHVLLLNKQLLLHRPLVTETHKRSSKTHHHCITIIRPRCSLSAAAYSHQTFLWTICRSVRLSSALWQNGGSDPDAVWHHRSTGPGMRQVVWFGIGPWDWVLLRVNLGHTIVTNGDFTVYVCDITATRPSSQV